jgi:hypothetical protein
MEGDAKTYSTIRRKKGKAASQSFILNLGRQRVPLPKGLAAALTSV